MSHDYKAVQWTPFKKRFDFWMLGGIAIYLVLFVIVSFVSQPQGESLHPVQIVMRAMGTLAFLLLTFILCIGPLARLSDRFKPFLYNRRHLGVTTFLIAFIHAGLAMMWYHGFSDTNPLVSLLISNPRYDSLAGFPFESLGFIALIIMFLMAATSHDFWNANLGPGLWKAAAYGCLFCVRLARCAHRSRRDSIRKGSVLRRLIMRRVDYGGWASLVYRSCEFSVFPSRGTGGLAARLPHRGNGR